MLKGNKGEWGEIYAFCYLLASGQLHAADKDLNALEAVYFPILKIIREELRGNVLNYHTGETIKIYLGDTLVKEVEKAEFDAVVSTLYDRIPAGERAFEIPEVSDFFASIRCTKLKASSAQKQDIVIQIHDINTGIKPICGFSIKSYLGSNPTLINSGENTNFVFEISGCSDEIMMATNAIDTRTKIIDKIRHLIECGCEFVSGEHLSSRQFEENLEFVDTAMPRLLSLALLYSYQFRLNSTKDIIKKMKDINPLSFSNTMMYEYKFKKLLCSCALGMTPEKQWEGGEDANGGYIVVKKDGTVVCYHLYNRTDFEQYLFDYTYFDRPSTSRYHYMDVYKENDKYKIKMNLQVRFK